MGSKTLDIDTAGDRVPGSDSAVDFGERDLDLVNALQINPRASWTLIGASLGFDATTVARRWRQLTESGVAWLTAYPPDLVTVGYIRLRCRAEALAEISNRLCASRYVFSAERTGGRYQLQLSVAAETPAALDGFASRWLNELPGVLEVNVAVGLRLYVDGSQWQPRALDPSQRAVLSAGDRNRPPVPPRPRPGDLGLILALGADARRSATDLAADTGLSDATVRRRLAEMTRSGRLLFRCDFAQQAAGWPVILNLRARLPATGLEAFGSALAGWSEIRLCVAVADDVSNVLLMAWLRTERECVDLESRLLQSFPELYIAERQLTLRGLKRMGRLLSPQGVATDHVPLAVWS